MYIYNTKDINGLISFKQITEADTIGTLVNKVNYNFDQIILFGGIKGDKGDKGDNGLPGATGKGKKGDKGDKGSNIYYENRTIISNSTITNPIDATYAEDDIIIDITGSYYKIVSNSNFELVYKFLFNINNSISNNFTTQFDYEQLLAGDVITKWVYKVDQSLSNSTQNTVLLVSKDSTDSISRLQRLVIGDDKYASLSQNSSFVVANIIDDSDTTNQTNSQILLAYRKDKNSPLSVFTAKHTLGGYDNLDSLYYDINLVDNSIRFIYGAGNAGDTTESRIAMSTKKFSIFGDDQNFVGTHSLDFTVSPTITTIDSKTPLFKLSCEENIELSSDIIDLVSSSINIGDGNSTSIGLLSNETIINSENLKITSSTGIFDLNIVTKTTKDFYVNSSVVYKISSINLSSTVLTIGSSPIYTVSTNSQQYLSTIASFAISNTKMNIGERVTLIFNFYATLVHSSVLKLSRGKTYGTYPGAVVTFIHTGYDGLIPIFTEESSTIYDKYTALVNTNNIWQSYNTDYQIASNISYNSSTKKLKVLDNSNLVFLANISGILSSFCVINSINLIDKDSNTLSGLSTSSTNLFNGGYLVINNNSNIPFVIKDNQNLSSESGLSNKGRIFLNGNSEILLKPKETIRLSRYVNSTDYEWEVVGSAYMGYAETQIGTDTSKYFKISEIEIKNSGALTDSINKDYSGCIQITQKNRNTSTTDGNIKSCNLYTTIRQNGVWSDSTSLSINSYIESNGVEASDIKIISDSIDSYTKTISIYIRCLDTNTYYSITKIGRSEICLLNLHNGMSSISGGINPSVNKWFEPEIIYNVLSRGPDLVVNVGDGVPSSDPNTPVLNQTPISVNPSTDEFSKTIYFVRNSSVNLGQNPALLTFRENGVYYGRGIRNLMNQTASNDTTRLFNFPIDFPFNSYEVPTDASKAAKYRTHHSSHTLLNEIEFTMEVSDGWYRDISDSTNKYCQIQKFYFHNANLYPTDYIRTAQRNRFTRYDTGLCYSRRIYNSSSSTVDMLSKSTNSFGSYSSDIPKSFDWNIHHSGESLWMEMNSTNFSLIRMGSVGSVPIGTNISMSNKKFYIKFLSHYTAEIKFRFSADVFTSTNQTAVLYDIPLRIYHPGDIDNFDISDDNGTNGNNNGQNFFYPNTLSYLCGNVQYKGNISNAGGATGGSFLTSLVALPRLLSPFDSNSFDKSGFSITLPVDDFSTSLYHGTGIISCKYTSQF